MTDKENYIQLFEKLKSSKPGDIGACFVDIVEAHLPLERAQQKEFAEAFYEWETHNVKANPLLFCYVQLIRAFFLFYGEKYDEVLPLLADIQNKFTEQNHPEGAAVSMVMQGSIFRTFGNVDLALQTSWAGREQLSKSEQFPFFQMACECNIGGIYIDRKRYDEAIQPFNSALELAEEAKKSYWIIYALHGLGKIYLAQKKYPEAKEYFERAMAEAEKSNNQHSVSNSLTELGNYYFQTEDYVKAEQFHKQSLVLREKSQFIGAAITNCICLGEIYIKLFKPEEAIAILEKGLKLATQIKVKLKMYPIHLLLSEVYQRRNEYEKSLFHYKLYHELREQVELEDSDRRIKSAQLIFEAEQTKKENIIIKKQKEEIEKKNIELQETIDELTRVRVGKKARAITLLIAIVFFIFEDTILHFALKIVPEDSYFLSMIVKMVIIFSLGPINKAIEHFLLKRIIKKKKREVLV